MLTTTGLPGYDSAASHRASVTLQVAEKSRDAPMQVANYVNHGKPRNVANCHRFVTCPHVYQCDERTDGQTDRTAGIYRARVLP